MKTTGSEGLDRATTTEAELRTRLDAVTAAEDRLARTVDSFRAGDLMAPSLCDGWTRGHVLAHVALNAHSLVNLIEWARTGTETPQYPSWEERDGDIARLSGRPKDEHLGALRTAAAAFRGAAESLPLDRWDFRVRGIGGEPQPVRGFLFARLREVEVHHADLAAGYGAADWEESFVRRALAEVPARLGPRVTLPFVVEATDLRSTLHVGDGEPVARVRGPGHALLSWLLGRNDGAGLDADGDVPRVPAWG